MAQKTFHYTNDEITVNWQPEICIHSAICFKCLAGVFDPRRRPWIVLENAGTDAIIRQIKECPSGALSYTFKKEMDINTKEAEPVREMPVTMVECVENGPYLIREEIKVKKPDGTEEKKTGMTALCRCGASRNKPYCDGMHSRFGFEG